MEHNRALCPWRYVTILRISQKGLKGFESRDPLDFQIHI